MNDKLYWYGPAEEGVKGQWAGVTNSLAIAEQEQSAHKDEDYIIRMANCPRKWTGKKGKRRK